MSQMFLRPRYVFSVLSNVVSSQNVRNVLEKFSCLANLCSFCTTVHVEVGPLGLKMLFGETSETLSEMSNLK